MQYPGVSVGFKAMKLARIGILTLLAVMTACSSSGGVTGLQSSDKFDPSSSQSLPNLTIYESTATTFASAAIETAETVSDESIDQVTESTNPNRLVETVFDVGFNEAANDVNRDLFQQLFGFPASLTGGEHLKIENGYLKQTYIPTKEGSDIVSAVVKSLPAAEERYLAYDVYFEDGWEWIKGGKLPGLAGGTYPTGGAGGDGTDGFSARLAWNVDGKAVVYAYHGGERDNGVRSSNYGEDFELSGKLEVGEWHRIVQRVKMNDRGTTNGEVEVWVNGEQRLLETGITWRTTGDFSVDAFIYASFYGGRSKEWAPSKTTHARFDNFSLTDSPPASFVR